MNGPGNRNFGGLGEGFIDPSYHSFRQFDFDKFRTGLGNTMSYLK